MTSRWTSAPLHVRAPWATPSARLVGNWLDGIVAARTSSRTRTSRKAG